MNGSISDFKSPALLDNPIWTSLTTTHAHLAVGADVGRGLARRYLTDIGPLSAFQEPTAQAYADLAAIVPEGDVAALFLEEQSEVPAGWKLVGGGALVQMICPTIPDPVDLDEAMVPMGAEDFPEMVALATLTEPGPFRRDTPKLGGFLGIRVGGRLAAMAGRRLSPNGFTEVSAVCTHPDFRGRGYARALVAAVARNIWADGLMPFLTSYEANAGAIRVYEQVGFVVRRSFQLAVMEPPTSRGSTGVGIAGATL